jgi:type II secretory ATPase GspE/PulE/Tfp pilus assembly ATPase PilB-like protein
MTIFLRALNISGKKTMEETYLLDTIIADAYLKGVSDIHFELLAESETSRVLIRMDGVLGQYMTLPCAAANDIVKKIKSMANLDIEDRHLPKIGRIKFKHKGLTEFHLTISIRPADGQREAATLKIQTT